MTHQLYNYCPVITTYLTGCESYLLSNKNLPFYTLTAERLEKYKLKEIIK